MKIRDRVAEFRRVRAAELLPHPHNWRTHSAAQQDALRGLLAEVGFAGALLARRLEDGRLQLIDGHLRAETMPDAELPVLIVDLTEEEAAKLLSLYDPLAALAGADSQRLAELIGEIETSNEALSHILRDLAASTTDGSLVDATSGGEAEEALPASFQVVIECDGEPQQRELYDRMVREGYRCRVLTL